MMGLSAARLKKSVLDLETGRELLEGYHMTRVTKKRLILVTELSGKRVKEPSVIRDD